MSNIISLQPSSYLAPGAYIGELIRPGASNVTSDNRTPCYIAKGSRLAKADVEIIKGKIWDETLTISNIPPYRAYLNHNSDGNKLNTKIVDNLGNILREDQYNFYSFTPNYADGIEINPDIYDNTLTYYISYQSIDLDIGDILPFDDIRTITSLGNTPGNPQYKENEDYYIPVTINDPVPSFSDTTKVFGSAFRQTGTGVDTPTLSLGSVPTNTYNRVYILQFSGKAGVSGSYTINCNWASMPTSLGAISNIEHFSPLFGDPNASTSHQFTVTQNATSTQVLEHGLSIDFNLWSGDTGFEDLDYIIVNAYTGAILEVDPRYSNEQFSTVSAVSQTFGTGISTITVNADTDYTGSNNEKYKFMLTSSALGVDGERICTFGYSSVGYGQNAEGLFILTEDVVGGLPQNTVTQGQFIEGIYFDIADITSMILRDTFELTANSPKIYMDSKDDRDYTFTINNVLYTPATQNGLLDITYVTNTPEGSWGTFQVDYASDRGQSILPNNLVLWWQNITNFNDGSTTPSHWTINDTATQSLTCSDTIRWDLNNKAEETIPIDEILTDITGLITGTPNTKYIIVNEPALEKPIISMATGVINPATITWNISAAQYVIFATDPNATLTAKYEYKGKEPVTGSTYWINANYIRPDEFYNKPIRITSIDEGRALLSPATTENDIYIMNELAWNQASNLSVMWIIQVKDADADGVYTTSDYKEAILASEDLAATTDICVLNKPSVIGDTLASLDRTNDPFKASERLGWFGLPSSYPIGDNLTPNTLRYLAGVTFQVYGNSPSHGTRILVGSREARTKIVMDSGTEVEVVVDGSFIAGALMALEGGFEEPAEDLLRKNLYGFTYIETFGDKSDRNNLDLGGSNIIWFTDSGNGVYAIQEDITTDPWDTFNQINNMTQKQWVTKNMRTRIDLALIGVLQNSTEEALGLIKGQIISNLADFVGTGKIAQFEDDSGNTRRINQSDVIVERDPNNRTSYNFMYRYYLKNVIKHLFGLFVVNTNDFNIGK